MPFTLSELQTFVDIVGTALLEEDAYLAGCLDRRSVPAEINKPPGILWLNNERYYQYLALRKLLLIFPRYVAIEEDYFDFVVYPEAASFQQKYETIGEMKRWMSENGEDEIPGMLKDIEKIKESGMPGFLLIVSANPTVETNTNISYLSERLKQPAKNITAPFRFTTHGYPKTSAGWSKLDLFVVGILIPADGNLEE